MYNLLNRLFPDHLDLLVLQDTQALREMLVPQVTLELPALLESPDPLVLTAPLVTLVLKEVRRKKDVTSFSRSMLHFSNFSL